MLFALLKYLSLFLIVGGLVLLVGGTALTRVRKDRLTPRMKGQLFFWRSVGFWSLIIGAFMIAEKFFPS